MNEDFLIFPGLFSSNMLGATVFLRGLEKTYNNFNALQLCSEEHIDS